MLTGNCSYHQPHATPREVSFLGAASLTCLLFRAASLVVVTNAPSHSASLPFYFYFFAKRQWRIFCCRHICFFHTFMLIFQCRRWNFAIATPVNGISPLPFLEFCHRHHWNFAVCNHFATAIVVAVISPLLSSFGHCCHHLATAVIVLPLLSLFCHCCSPPSLACCFSWLVPISGVLRIWLIPTSRCG
jgi:hypothetical protein